MGKIADQYLTIAPWKLIEEGFHPDRSRVSESLFSLSNEHMGVRGFFEEDYSGERLIGSYLNGIYEEHYLAEPMSYKGISNRICFMVNTVNWLACRLSLEDEVLDLHQSRVKDFRRELDFRTGELRREFTWITRDGKELRLTFARLLSMQTKEACHQQITLTPINFSGKIQLTMNLDFSARHEMYNRNYWTCPRKESHGMECAILGESIHIHQKLFAASRLFAPEASQMTFESGDKNIDCRFVIEASRGEVHSVGRNAVLYTSRNPEDTVEDTWSAGQNLVNDIRAFGYAQALAENSRYWEDFWDHADIEVEGDPETQQGIRYCIFQLQQTYRGVVDGTNIGAKGLTGEFYNGNAFWDTETYCLPYYIFNNPAAAKSLLDYRYRTLPQAINRAKDLDCSGACFPLATIDGTESCTLWQHASLQLQSTTAVAYAIWHYTRVTRDVEYLNTKGVEMLIPICRFLATRGQWSPRQKTFGYYAVMGPDEFHMMVNNNCYTNYLAKRTFLFTLQTMAEMTPEQRRRMSQTYAVTPDEEAQWQEMADHIHIPFDSKSGVYEQHEGYFDLPHIDVDSIPVEDFPLYNNWSYDRIFRTDMIKQPDVLMFLFLFNQSFSRSVKQANYEYYEPRCVHESSLSPSLHSILASELDRPQEAFEFFQFATRIDLDNYNRNTAEGIHMTSIAAAWLNVVYGFGGMRSDGETLVFHPTIPLHWQGYRFQILVRDSILRISVSQKEAVFQIREGPPVPVLIKGKRYEISGTPLSVSI
jgi:maltose phosphorylase